MFLDTDRTSVDRHGACMMRSSAKPHKVSKCMAQIIVISHYSVLIVSIKGLQSSQLPHLHLHMWGASQPGMAAAEWNSTWWYTLPVCLELWWYTVAV